MSLIYILRDGVVVDAVSKAAVFLFRSGKPDASLRCPLLNHDGSKANAFTKLYGDATLTLINLTYRLTRPYILKISLIFNDLYLFIGLTLVWVFQSINSTLLQNCISNQK